MIIKSYLPHFIILGIIIGTIIISLITFFTYDTNDDEAVVVSILVGMGFAGFSLGIIAFYGLIKAIYRKQLRAFISWIVLIGIYFLLGFVFKFTDSGSGADSGALGIFYIGLMIMGGNEVLKIWQTRKPKSNNQSPPELS